MPKVPCFESTTGATPGCMNIPRLIQYVEYDRFGRDRRKLARLQNRGELVRVRRGIHVESAEWMLLSEQERHVVRAMACARLAATEPVFLPRLRGALVGPVDRRHSSKTAHGDRGDQQQTQFKRRHPPHRIPHRGG